MATATMAAPVAPPGTGGAPPGPADVPVWAVHPQDADEQALTWLPLPHRDRYSRPLGVLVVRCRDRSYGPTTTFRARLFAGLELVGYAKLTAPATHPAARDLPTVCDLVVRPSSRGQRLSSVLLNALRGYFASDLAVAAARPGDEEPGQPVSVVDWLTGLVVE